MLLSEDFEVTDRDVTLLRQNLGLRMRDPNNERRASAIQDIGVETTIQDLDRLKKRCDESDERLIMGTRRVRTRTWNGIPADDPDLEPRFPSEKTISACKKDLGLGQDRKKYTLVRDTFQRMCTEAGIMKKSHDPEAWEQVKLSLVDAVPSLDQAYSQPSRPKKGDPMWFALDIICSDVAKKIRVLNAKLDIKQVKQTLKLDPHEVTTFRRNFVEILRDANFKSRFDVPADGWDRLKRNLHSRSTHLQAVLPTEVWDHKNDKRVKAFEFLCRDVTKRYKDRRGHSRKAVKDEEGIKPEPESPANKFQGLSHAEPESPANEVQGLHPPQPKGEVPIEPELLAPRLYSGDMVNQRPVLRYTIEGLATVVLEPESSVQNRDDPFSPLETHQMHSTVGSSQMSTPFVSNHDCFTHPFGLSSAASIPHNGELNAIGGNDYDNFMHRVGPYSSIAINEDNHFGKQILQDHADFAHQYGYGTPPDYPFMVNGYPNLSAQEDHDGYVIRNGLEPHHIFPIVGIDYPNMPIIGEHQNHLYQLTEDYRKHFRANKGITQPEFPKGNIDPSNVPLNKHQGDFFPRFGSQPVLRKATTDPADIPVDKDHGNIFPQFGAQPELSIMKNDDSRMHVMDSIEVDSPFEIIENDQFYLGPDDVMSDRDTDEGSTNKNAGSFQSFEYPDPTDYAL